MPPGWHSIPQVFNGRIVVQGDAVIEFLAAQSRLVGVAQIRVIHSKVIARMVIRSLCQRAEVGRKATCKENTQLQRKSDSAVLCPRRDILKSGVREQYQKRHLYVHGKIEFRGCINFVGRTERSS